MKLRACKLMNEHVLTPVEIYSLPLVEAEEAGQTRVFLSDFSFPEDVKLQGLLIMAARFKGVDDASGLTVNFTLEIGYTSDFGATLHLILAENFSDTLNISSGSYYDEKKIEFMNDVLPKDTQLYYKVAVDTTYLVIVSDPLNDYTFLWVPMRYY